MNLLVMAHATVGLSIVRWLGQHHPADLSMVVTTENDEIYEEAERLGVDCVTTASIDDLPAYARARNLRFDLGVLAWWPKLIDQALIDLPQHGFINTHPSLLPHNRGRHYNFWALVEEAPFGVSLHYVDHGIDSGDIIAQQPVPYGWEDTGETLYLKAQQAMTELFAQTYPKLRDFKIERLRQDPDLGSFHYASEMDRKSEIYLEGSYTGRELLNVLRARTFPGHPGCRFSDDGHTYEVQVSIRKVSR